MKTMRHILLTAFLLGSAGLFAQGYFILGYGPSFPLGPTKDYIDRASWRSFNGEGGGFVTKHLSVGVSFSWYGYYKEFPLQTYYDIEGSKVTVTGKQWRYANMYPLMAVVKYYVPIKDLDFRPYAGVGIGACFVNRTMDFGLYSVTNDDVQFGFYPEIGFSYWFNSGFAVSLDGRYNYAIGTKDLPDHSNITVAVNLIWKFGARNFTFTD